MGLDISLYVMVEVGQKDPERVIFFRKSVTHNLVPMAKACGCYTYVWRPEEVGIHFAYQMLHMLRSAIKYASSNPKILSEHNPYNDWGNYDVFLMFLQDYLKGCERYPATRIHISR
jgi:hypothetical protein